MDYVCAQQDTLNISKHCRANLDSRRTPVERKILSVPVNDKLLIRMVNAKRIRYGSDITSPTCSKGKFQLRCFKITLDLRRIPGLRGLYSIMCGLS
jgi:hypothetical protein